MKKNKFPQTPGVVVKTTKNGQRFLLHDKDTSGRDIYVTIPIQDTDCKKEYLEKVEKARIKLNAKKIHVLLVPLWMNTSRQDNFDQIRYGPLKILLSDLALMI